MKPDSELWTGDFVELSSGAVVYRVRGQGH